MKGLISLLLCFVSSTCLCSQGASTSDVIIPENYNPENKGKKRMPSRNYILFSYDVATGYCSFVLPEGIDYVAVKIESESGDIYYGEISSDNSIMCIFLNNGGNHIVCIANNGTVFEGDVWI